MKKLVEAPSLVGIGDSDSAAHAYAALGMSPLRLEVLRFVLSRRETAACDVMGEFGISRNGALQQLSKLTSEGLLVTRRCTHPRGSGPITYWSADEGKVEDLLESLIQYLFDARAV